MRIKIAPSAREHLIGVWQSRERFPALADDHVCQLLQAVTELVVQSKAQRVCAELAENILFVRHLDHVFFLRALAQDEMGIVAVVHKSMCASIMQECAPRRY